MFLNQIYFYLRARIEIAAYDNVFVRSMLDGLCHRPVSAEATLPYGHLYSCGIFISH